ncbi:MAG: hypothetical protein A3C70_02675 [Candidatus Zambryskibacteria bacterium RIFCSPHIGHO2_02_FULL_43_14]|uniref:Uncharacterized protein n=1 Tax=Candidatus Zambryskibacteria bacterium RIFCSPHIGHO2_02_FULL_43_14 TaxID=1802748 RepID=A0A1G2THG6_9BACT|nr:MAG: hypothetical protein A2829_01180 [Candidatus Zambryskibacteria bacterium RIFCSPHIGHO2_01_FULL_43_60]OHA96099.1 MAG: hypothetical protein A3C70_02675 [Candidatus Zambryskibacteria bacterium RIFCSPHIGHO2_02_FULL_43_14]OHB03502.1 MAG: hypothetical protein A3B03_00545 [Candidatus Zambryskibacteria bacterium RIFCSPLOWO2_01_FULL_42_41]
MSNSTDKVTKILFILVSALVLAAIANNFYTFYFQKNYTFTVEASCDQTQQSCFIRDCSDGECPPNELEVYRVFTLKAGDFKKCSDDSCLNECTNGLIKCTEIFCGESKDDVCTVVTTE